MLRALLEEGGGLKNETSGEGEHTPSVNLLEADGVLAGVAVISILIVFSLILEKLHHKATMYARNTGKKHVSAIIKKVTTELMILGLVSFLFFTLIQSGNFERILHLINVKTVDEEFIEFIHMFLFVVVLIYVTIVVFLLILGGFIKSQWKKLERRALNRESPRRAGKIMSYFNVAIKYYHFVRLRENFILAHNLPEDFEYYKYLKRIYSQTFSEIVELNWKVWIIVLIVMSFNYLDSLFHGTFSIGTAVVFLFSLYMWYRVIEMRNKMVEDQAYFIAAPKPKGMYMETDIDKDTKILSPVPSPELKTETERTPLRPSIERIPSEPHIITVKGQPSLVRQGSSTFMVGGKSYGTSEREQQKSVNVENGSQKAYTITPVADQDSFYDYRRSMTPQDAIAIDINLKEKRPTPRWKICCIPCCTTNTRYESMFPFGKPHSLVYMAQMLVFVQSVYISVSIMVLYNQLASNVALMILNIALPIINITFVIGASVPIICQVLAIHPHYHYIHSSKKKIAIAEIKQEPRNSQLL